MKTRNFKAMGAAVALLLGMGISSSAQAFTVTQGLGVSPVATDIIRFVCPAGTASVRGQITDAGLPVAAPRVRLGLLSTAGIMPVVQSAQEGPSIIVGRAAVPGVQWALITKDLAGPENYRASINCHNAAGAILGAFGLALTQNQ